MNISFMSGVVFIIFTIVCCYTYHPKGIVDTHKMHIYDSICVGIVSFLIHFCILEYTVDIYQRFWLHILCMVLIVLSYIDCYYMIIPNILVVYIFLISVILSIWVERSMLEKLTGMSSVSLVLIGINYIKKDSFGGGDIKLMFVIGYLLGPILTYLSLCIASIIGSIYGSRGYLKKEQQYIPFGPCLCVGIIVALLYGEFIWNSYW